MIEDDSDVIWRFMRHHVRSVSQCQTIIRSTDERKEHVADKNWVPHSSVKKRIFEQTDWALKEKLSALDTLDGNRFQILGNLYHKKGMGLGSHKRLYFLGPTQDFKFPKWTHFGPISHPYTSLLPFTIYYANINANLCVNVMPFYHIPLCLVVPLLFLISHSLFRPSNSLQFLIIFLILWCDFFTQTHQLNQIQDLFHVFTLPHFSYNFTTNKNKFHHFLPHVNIASNFR